MILRVLNDLNVWDKMLTSQFYGTLYNVYKYVVVNICYLGVSIIDGY